MKASSILLLTAAVFLAACVEESEDSTTAGLRSSSEITYVTYVEDGNVWIESDCPNTDQALTGSGDGLPHISSTTDRQAIEEWFGNPENSRIIPRNGEVWERTADGRIEVTQVEDWMIEATIDDPGKCPGAPTSTNGVPVVYRVVNN